MYSQKYNSLQKRIRIGKRFISFLLVILFAIPVCVYHFMTKDLLTGFSDICVIIGLIGSIYFQIRKSHSHGIVEPEEILNETFQEQVYLFSNTPIHQV